MIADRWYQNAIIYAVDVQKFQDSNGDGIGDLTGLRRRVNYIASLGADCVWLLPHYASPRRDDGYDVADYFAVDERIGDLGDFAELTRHARSVGVRVMCDLVVNHTSIDHPWFQDARSSKDARFRDYYIWRDKPDPSTKQAVFTKDDNKPWQYDRRTGQYYLHQFYKHEPDLNVVNPEVRREIERIVQVWRELGADGFRIDAAPYVGAKAAPAYGGDVHGFFHDLRSTVEAWGSEAVLMAEADVDPTKINEFFGSGNEMHLLLNFTLAAFLFLALARENAEVLGRIVNILGHAPPPGLWANFARNHDELNIERLSADERESVFEAFAPDERMRIFGRGIRRRLAPILDGDERRLRLVFSVLFALPGVPVIFYGDEIGMGDDLSLPGRESVRTPMQWSDGANAGFSSAPAKDLVVPVISNGRFSYTNVNVAAQRLDPDSMLNWMRRLMAVRREHSELAGEWKPLDVGDDRVLVIEYRGDGGRLVTAHNFSSKRVEIELPSFDPDERVVDVFADHPYEPFDRSAVCKLEPHGYRWTHATR